MVRATLHFKARPGRDAEVEATWRAIAEQVRHVPGNLRQALMRDPEDPTAFLLTSDWLDHATFTRFERSPEQDELTAPLRALRESARMTVHELVAHYEGDAHR